MISMISMDAVAVLSIEHGRLRSVGQAFRPPPTEARARARLASIEV